MTTLRTRKGRWVRDPEECRNGHPKSADTVVRKMKRGQGEIELCLLCKRQSDLASYYRRRSRDRRQPGERRTPLGSAPQASPSSGTPSEVPQPADLDHVVYPRAGERKRLREAAGLSQRELAARLGASQVAICNWETGSREPRGPIRYRYFALLGALQPEAP